MNKNIIYAGMIGLGLAVSTGCEQRTGEQGMTGQGTTQERTVEGQSPGQLEEQAQAQTQELERRYKERVDSLEADWDRVREQADQRPELKEEFSVMKDQVDESLTSVRSKISEFGGATGEKANMLRADVERGISTLQASIERAKSHLQETTVEEPEPAPAS